MKFTSYFSLLTFFLLAAFPIPQYADDSFNWQTLESGMLKVHWYEGDASFGQEALKAAQVGLDSIGGLLPVDLAQPVEIFIYASADDLQGALTSGKEDWIAGHADPALGLVHVLVEPDSQQAIAMEQRIPHELMHVMMYRRVGAGYKHLPVWLREGMATLVEIYPNAEYDRVLKDAAVGNVLIPLPELCVSFPTDMAQAFLAYSESRSFTNYLHQTYGATGLQNLTAAYADGMDCQRGTERAFGIPLANLEQKWRSSVLRENTISSTMQNISPYLVLLCIVLIIPLISIASTLRKGVRNEPGANLRK